MFLSSWFFFFVVRENGNISLVWTKLGLKGHLILKRIFFSVYIFLVCVFFINNSVLALEKQSNKKRDAAVCSVNKLEDVLLSNLKQNALVEVKLLNADDVDVVVEDGDVLKIAGEKRFFARANIPQVKTFSDGVIKQIEVARNSNVIPYVLQGKYYPIDCVKIRLAKSVPYSVDKKKNVLSIKIGNVSPAGFSDSQFNQVVGEYIQAKKNQPERIILAKKNDIKTSDLKNVEKDFIAKKSDLSDAKDEFAIAQNKKEDDNEPGDAYQAPIMLDVVFEEKNDSAIVGLMFDKIYEYSVEYKKDSNQINIYSKSTVYTDLKNEILCDGKLVKSIRILSANSKIPAWLDGSFYPFECVSVNLSGEVEYEVSEDVEEGMVSFHIKPVAPDSSKLSSESEVSADANMEKNIEQFNVLEKEQPIVDKEISVQDTSQEEAKLDEGTATTKLVQPNSPVENTSDKSLEIFEEKKVPSSTEVLASQQMEPAFVGAPILLDIFCENHVDSAVINFLPDIRFEYKQEILDAERKIVITPVDPMYTDVNEKTVPGNGIVKSITIVKRNIARPDSLDESFYGVKEFVVELNSSFSLDAEQQDSELLLNIKAKSDVLPVQSQSKEEVVQNKFDSSIENPSIPIVAETGVEEDEKVYENTDNKKAEPSNEDKKTVGTAGSELEKQEFMVSQIPAQVVKNPTPVLVPAKEEVVVNAPILLDISSENNDDTAVVNFFADVSFKYTQYQLDDPFRIVIDPVVLMYTDLDKRMDFKNGIIKSIKILPLDAPRSTNLDESFYAMDAIVIELNRSAEFNVKADKGEYSLTVDASNMPVLKKVVPANELSKSSEKEESVLKSKKQMEESDFIPNLDVDLPRESEEKIPECGDVPWIDVLPQTLAKEEDLDPEGFSFDGEDLNSCIDIAIANNRQLRVAREEFKHARMKLFESQRGLFANLKLKGTATKGIASGLGFRERRYGVEFEQPLYYSGRLWNTYKQARLNCDVASKKMDKIRIDTVQKVTEAFNNLQKMYSNYRQHYTLLKRCGHIRKLSEYLYKKQLITELELLNVQSQHSQVIYQIESSKKDVKIARLKFQKELSLPYDDELVVVKPEFSFYYVDIDLQNALELAYANRADLQINRLLVKVNKLGESIAKAKENFNVTATGFMGESGSAYQTEPLKYKYDYTFGLQVKKNFWGNIGDISHTKNRTAPKLGQDTRTSSNAYDFSLGILDGLGGLSEIQKAHIEYLKSIDDKMTIEQSVELEVKEAYYNYKKALIQLGNSTQKIKIKYKELNVARLQTAYHETPESKLLESYVKFSEEFIQYNDTLNNYFNALNNLNKAIGIDRYYEKR